ncbi:cupin domain-containing protein [Dasania marina]|uniref:cupin domain-containing protein n=1 Tax=Dasania marina TaxID=471499 RepID=UPI000368EEFA|nr:cupin domain-containing protein [Dasania marina]
MPVKHIFAFDSLQGQDGESVTAPAEVMLSGNPVTTDWPAFDSADGRVSIGIWESQEYHKIKQHPNEMEYCLILEGTVRISDKEGNSQEFSQGQAFIVQPGFDGVWESLGKVRKHYIICQCS